MLQSECAWVHLIKIRCVLHIVKFARKSNFLKENTIFEILIDWLIFLNGFALPRFCYIVIYIYAIILRVRTTAIPVTILQST